MDAFTQFILFTVTACLGSFAMGLYLIAWQPTEITRITGLVWLLLGAYAVTEIIRISRIERSYRKNTALLRRMRDESLADRDRNGLG